MSEFSDWAEDLNRIIRSLDRSFCGFIIDSNIPYRLGWSPTRAARAIMNLDRHDCDTLRDLMKKGTPSE